ncbi:MAG: hypothetical protein DMF63_11475 [Acidobacteria bacterium]|nr:MAG: hypothetical protein DMF63_11475 [Acidobacteriota bacterium]
MSINQRSLQNFVVLLSLLLSLLAPPLNAQPRPKPEREFRAVWIATVDNIDFPTQKGLPPEKQKAELLASLDLAKKLRLNAVIFQVRPMADAVYRSQLEPWSEFLTGEMGKPQDFDPLEFVVSEAHKRGILVHAWFNPYRAYHPSARTMSDDHVARRKPTAVRQYGRYMWLDPTSPEAQRHSLDVIEDVVRRYDVDGVHFDDYFYPYAENDAAGHAIEFPDDTNWAEYQKTDGKLSRDDWRRSNVNSFIEAVGRAIKKIKPDVVYGISPFGIWQPVPEKGIAGFNAYAELYADSRKWLQDGTVDYLSPQFYWETSRKGLSFPVLLDWWSAQNTKGRFIWPGVAAYRIGSTPTFTSGEIASQIAATRLTSLTSGAIYFSFKSLRNDMGGIQKALSEDVYKHEAIIPEFTWIKSSRPSPPKVSIRSGIDYIRVSWKEVGNRKAFWFVVYAKDKDGWSYSILPASEHKISLSADRRIEKIIVTSVDRLGRESAGK